MTGADRIGKEAAHIRHELLRAYLEPLFMIIGQRESRIGYIDSSRGPWRKGGQGPGDTPAAISLGIMEKCHNELLEKFRKNVHFRGLFIEGDGQAFGELESFLESESWNGVDARCLKGDFCDLRSEILSWCGNRDFCFFSIDAMEWRHIAIPTLSPFLERPSCEFLIDFVSDSIPCPRNQESFEEHMKTIFGEEPDSPFTASADICTDPPKEKKRLLFDLYRRALKTSAPLMEGAIPRCGHMRVLHPTKERTFHDLVYLTWDPLGLVTFMEASEQLDREQRKLRALARQSKKVKRSRQLELFPADRFVNDEPAGDTTKAKEYWLAKLSNAPRRFGVAEFADMVEETGWFVGDFQKAFAELESEGKVRNLASSGIRTENPVRYWANGNLGEPLEKIEKE